MPILLLVVALIVILPILALVVGGIILLRKKKYKPLIYLLITVLLIVLHGSYQNATESCSEQILYGAEFIDDYEVKQVNCKITKVGGWLRPRIMTTPRSYKSGRSFFINGKKAKIDLKSLGYFKMRFGEYLVLSGGIVIITPEKIIKVEDNKEVLDQLNVDWTFESYHNRTLYIFSGDEKKVLSYNLDNRQLKTLADLKGLPVKSEDFRPWKYGHFIYSNNEPILLRFETISNKIDEPGSSYQYEYNLKTGELKEISRDSVHSSIYKSAWKKTSNVFIIETQKTEKKAKDYKLRYPINIWFDLHSIIFDWSSN